MHTVKKKRPKLLIGRREQIGFPDLGLDDVTAKIDTGAYSSAIHCHQIREQNGVLYFKLLSPLHPGYKNEECSTTHFIQKEIRNSFGESETRYIIETRVRIGQRLIKSVISLSNRGTMRYPVLIGRRLLKNKFVVDVEQLNLAPLHILAYT
jgi:hypothetical protein